MNTSQRKRMLFGFTKGVTMGIVEDYKEYSALRVVWDKKWRDVVSYTVDEAQHEIDSQELDRAFASVIAHLKGPRDSSDAPDYEDGVLFSWSQDLAILYGTVHGSDEPDIWTMYIVPRCTVCGEGTAYLGRDRFATLCPHHEWAFEDAAKEALKGIQARADVGSVIAALAAAYARNPALAVSWPDSMTILPEELP